MLAKVATTKHYRMSAEVYQPGNCWQHAEVLLGGALMGLVVQACLLPTLLTSDITTKVVSLC